MASIFRERDVRRLPAGYRLHALVVAFVLLLVLASCVETGDSDDTATTQANGTVPGDTDGSEATLEPAERAEELAERIAPSVVEVRAIVSSSPLAQQFGSGGGVVYRSDGVIVTNDHVITAGGEEPEEDIAVILASGDEYSAQVLGREPGADLAVLQIDARDLQPVRLIDDLATVEVGQQAVAIGSRSLEDNVTIGSVVRILRGIQSPTLDQLDTFIQTDAEVQQGNSGGPLVNLDGDVIGIILAGTVGTGSFEEGLGLAIPAPTVASVVDRLLEAR